MPKYPLSTDNDNPSSGPVLPNRNINCVRKTTIHQKNKNGNFLFMSPHRVSRHLICER